MSASTTHRQASDSEFVGRITDILPAINERGPLGDELRRLPRETVDDLISAGVARALVPREHGGDDLSLDAYVDATLMLAGADPSTGWCASLMLHQPVFVGMFPVEAQAEVWADGPNVPIASSVMPATRVTAVNGGYRLSGNAPFCSGSAHSDWCLLGGFVVDEHGSPEWYMFLVPSSDYEVKDVWHTTGMRGTGSNIIVTDNAFVPASRAIRQADLLNGTGPGSLVNADSKFRMPWVAFGGFGFACTIVGAAQGAFRYFRDMTAGRRGMGGVPLRDIQTIQAATGRIAARLDAAELIEHAGLVLLDSEPVSLETRARLMRDHALTCQLAVGSIEEMITTSGTSAHAEGNLLERFARDVRMASAHVSVNPEHNYAHWGRVTLEAPWPADQPFF